MQTIQCRTAKYHKRLCARGGGLYMVKPEGFSVTNHINIRAQNGMSFAFAFSSTTCSCGVFKKGIPSLQVSVCYSWVVHGESGTLRWKCRSRSGSEGSWENCWETSSCCLSVRVVCEGAVLLCFCRPSTASLGKEENMEIERKACDIFVLIHVFDRLQKYGGKKEMTSIFVLSYKDVHWTSLQPAWGNG